MENMMSKKNQNNEFQEAEKFVDNFIHFISDTENIDDKAIDNVLEKKGVDVSQLIGNVQQMVDQALDDDRLSWQKEAKESRKKNQQQFKEKTKALPSLGKEELFNRFKEIIKSDNSDLVFAHRNLEPEKFSEDELREIISEYDQLGDKG